MSTETTKQPLTLAKINELKENSFSTIHKDSFKNYVKIPVDSYESLNWKIENLIGVCQSALFLLGENRNNHLNDVEHLDIFKSCPTQIVNVLQIVKDLLPSEEMEFLDKLNGLN